MKQINRYTLAATYHALGKDTSSGLDLFRYVFHSAERQGWLDDLESLLGLLCDPTLPDTRLRSWYIYYKARQQLQLHDLAGVERLLGEMPKDSLRTEAQLGLYRDLLAAQVALERGGLVGWRLSLERLLQAAEKSGDTLLILETSETLARAYLQQVVLLGGWIQPGGGRLARLAAFISQALIIPLMLPVALYLLIAGRKTLWHPVRRYSGSYMNWIVFMLYERVDRALRSAEATLPQALLDATLDDPLGEKTACLYRYQFDLQLLHARVEAEIGVESGALLRYQALAQISEQYGSEYEQALVDFELTRLALAGRPGDTAALEARLMRIRSAYQESYFDWGVSQVEYLLGDLHSAQPETALEHWTNALDICQERGDQAGTAAGLSRCYQLLRSKPGDAVAAKVRQALDEVGEKVYTARLPNALLKFLQLLGWLSPLLVALGFFLYFGNFTASATRTDYREFVAFFLSYRSLLVLLGFFLGWTLLYDLAGLIGLVSSLYWDPARVERFSLTREGIRRVHPKAAEGVTAWDEVEGWVQVARGLGTSATPGLSHLLLQRKNRPPLQIPGVTAWFAELKDELKVALGRAPETIRIQFNYGLIFWLSIPAAVLAFLLVDLFLYPALSAGAHAIGLVVVMTGFFAYFLWVTGGWLWQTLRTYRAGLPWQKYLAGVVLVGVGLTVGGHLLRDIIYPGGAVLVAWGCIGLGGLLWQARQRKAGRATLAGLAILLVSGGALLVVNFVPPILHSLDFLYEGAVIRLQPGEVDYLSRRDAYFEQIERFSRWIIRLDPEYTEGYGYLGAAELSNGNYQASVEAYSEALSQVEYSQYRYCRALAYALRGDAEAAAQDYAVFLELDPGEQPPRCQCYFPEWSDLLQVP